AKKALPNCGGGTILGVQNGEFGCVNVGFVTSEVDPTVQQFAKQPLPSCGIGEVLAVGADKSLVCSSDDQGVPNETDPYVLEFARSDAAGAVPNCGAGESLTMVGGRLACKVDSTGLTEEKDPLVQDFAR